MREGDVVIVARLDRLARSTRDLLELAEVITTAGASLKSLGEPWADTTTPAGKMVLTVFAGIAEFERSLIGERTGAGRVAAKKLGVKFGRKPKLTPLTELEEALLVGAGAGFTGLAFWDLPTPAPYPRFSGRAFPTTRAGGHTALFLTNDEGFYVLDDKVAASKLREVETREERNKPLDIYRAQRRTLKRGRLDIPRRVPPMSGHDLWDSNRPGSTLFLPVCDVSASLISLIAQFVDPALRKYASASGGMNIVDDRYGFRPAGTGRWLKDGFLNVEQVLPLSILERQACYYVFSEPAAICQNMFLATEALGLGGWKHCGFLSFEILERMGFRMAATEGGSGFGNPIGLDGVFEASCPPYYPTMDAAVDAFFSRTPREATAPVPHLMSDEEHRAGTVRVSAAGLACTKAVCKYIYDTYGRFPGATDAMHLMSVMQVHHIDTDYYNRFFGSSAYGPTHAAHMATWHR